VGGRPDDTGRRRAAEPAAQGELLDETIVQT
jgi:hypothetical protein